MQMTDFNKHRSLLAILKLILILNPTLTLHQFNFNCYAILS